jgi:hypothetical protein
MDTQLLNQLAATMRTRSRETQVWQGDQPMVYSMVTAVSQTEPVEEVPKPLKSVLSNRVESATVVNPAVAPSRSEYKNSAESKWLNAPGQPFDCSRVRCGNCYHGDAKWYKLSNKEFRAVSLYNERRGLTWQNRY